MTIPCEDADERDAERAGDGERELGPADAVEPAQLGDVEQADRRRDDDRREHRLRHRLDEARDEQQHREHQGRRDEAGQLGLRARLEGHGRPRAARADREAGEQAGGEVGRADPGQLLVAVHLVAGARREAAGGRDRVADGDERDPDRRGEQDRDVRRVGTAGKVGTGKPWGSTPITETPCAARSSTIESTIATTTATRMPGVRGESRLRPRMMARLSRPIPSAHGFVMPSRPWRNATRSSTRPLGVGREPEQLGQLADEDDDREAGQVAGPHRVREQVGDEAELARRPRRP